ncbi:PaaI family thioesterase [Novosphingobium lentum]|uniref:PaaI family thioesterase n=1 Tax=Novosphingobium lentum TaxID=145287 RepID=UPI000836AC99|nr:PaaI family thioesterase [Novosphingobium lentum]
MTDPRPGFVSNPDPANPGWLTWHLSDSSRFNAQILGKMLVRLDDDGRARTRMFPERRHTNLMDNLHGGTILSLIDVSLFAGSRLFGLIEAGTSVTLDLSVQFLGAGQPDRPIDAVVELLKETRRLLFLRGLVEQDDERIAAFSGTIRKPTAR